VHPGERVLGILGDGLVEAVVLLVLDIASRASPDGSLRVDLGPLDDLLVDLLGLSCLVEVSVLVEE